MAAASYLIGLLGFVVFVLSFMILLRFSLPVGWFSLEILTGIVIHLATSATGFILLDGFSYWYQASVYAFLWFCFFFVSSIYSVSVSLGIINYLYEQPNHTAPLHDVYQHCIVKAFESRAEFLMAAKQVQRTDQGYAVTATGKRAAQRLQSIQKTLGMESQGFYSSEPTLLTSQGGGEQQ